MLSDWTRLLKAAFIAYRLTRLVVHEDGPFDVMTQLRTAVVMNTERGGWLQRGISCPHCVSFWLAIPAYLLARWPASNWLVVAGLVSLIYRKGEP